MNIIKSIFTCCHPKENDLQQIEDNKSIIQSIHDRNEFPDDLDNKSFQEHQDELEVTNALLIKSKTQFDQSDQSLITDKGKVISFKKKKTIDLFSEKLNQDRQLSPEEIKASPIISLEDPSGIIFPTKEIQLNAGGLLNSSIRKSNGFIIFGKQTSNQVDYHIEYDNKKERENNLPYLFMIYYHKELNSYVIKFYPDSHIMTSIAVIRLSSLMEVFIERTEVLIIGMIVMHIVPLSKHKGEIELIDMTNGKKRRSFDYQQKIITIGRDKNCTISFPDEKELSKVHLSLYYIPMRNGWILKDGSETRTSTNGTWISGLNTYVMKNDMIISLYKHHIKVKF